MSKTVIRDSEIQELQNRVLKSDMKYFLRSMRIHNLRGFQEADVRFDFPVTVFIGPNGGGKTTLLEAAGILYKSIKPSDLFVKSPMDTGMTDVEIEYRAVDKIHNPTDTVKRTAHFKTMKWKRDALDRPMVFLGIMRTIPATERKELYKYRSPSAQINTQPISLNSEVIDYASRILGKTLKGHSTVALTSGVSMYLGQSVQQRQYSEFHFGAGEANVLRIVSALESMETYGLALIEEIENGLHPIAVKCLVEYLLDVSLRRKIQVVFTTHAQQAIDVLPDNAVWSSVNFVVRQGRMDILSLRAVIGDEYEHDAIFVEDRFAEQWVRAMLRYAKNDVLTYRFDVFPVSGFANVREFTRRHNELPTIKTRAVGVLDGDFLGSLEAREYRLPGKACPAEVIFQAVERALPEVAAKLSLLLLQGTGKQSKVIEEVERARPLLKRDPHLIFAKLGENLGFLSEETVINAFLTIWCELNPEEIRRFEELLSPAG